MEEEKLAKTLVPESVAYYSVVKPTKKAIQMLGLFGGGAHTYGGVGECGESQVYKQCKYGKLSLGSLESLNPVSVSDYSGVRGSRWPWPWLWLWLWVWPWPSGSPIYPLTEDSIGQSMDYRTFQ